MSNDIYDYIRDPIAHAQVMRSRAIAEAMIEGFAALGRVIRPVVENVSKYMAYRRIHRALSEMTDRELDDIGLCRGDIETVARGNDPRPQREAFLEDALAQRAKLEETFEDAAEPAVRAGANDNRSAAAA